MTATRNPEVEQTIRAYMNHIKNAIDASHRKEYQLAREILDRMKDSIEYAREVFGLTDQHYQEQLSSLREITLPLRNLIDSQEQMREEQR